MLAVGAIVAFGGCAVITIFSLWTMASHIYHMRLPRRPWRENLQMKSDHLEEGTKSLMIHDGSSNWLWAHLSLKFQRPVRSVSEENRITEHRPMRSSTSMVVDPEVAVRNLDTEKWGIEANIQGNVEASPGPKTEVRTRGPAELPLQESSMQIRIPINPPSKIILPCSIPIPPLATQQAPSTFTTRPPFLTAPILRSAHRHTLSTNTVSSGPPIISTDSMYPASILPAYPGMARTVQPENSELNRIPSRRMIRASSLGTLNQIPIYEEFLHNATERASEVMVTWRNTAAL
ncbi:hypothetical protein BDZ94DRAFT_1310410 [Collybia nuda]|uniref:Uncharacterized protein n=1 Tax=Collybia nuda TaxID=64659 RepID=A0A9P5Y1N8_9AGAR|nr:hypothetical protein BDZ94DRAFT_1310410 [Collybia nuda]